MPPLGTLPDYMQGMLSPDEYMRTSREQGIADFNAQGQAPPGSLGTLSSRSLFGGNTGQNGPLVSSVNKYNYAQRDAYQKAMLTGTQQAHAMNLQNTQQAQSMLNDSRNFGLNSQQIYGGQYLRGRELEQQRAEQEGRLALDTRAHQDRLGIEQGRLGLDTRVHQDRLGLDTQRLGLDTQVHNDRLGLDTQRLGLDTQVHRDRLGLDTKIHDEMMPLRTRQADLEDRRLGLDTQRFGLDTQVHRDRFGLDSKIHEDMMPLRTRQADLEDRRLALEGELGRGRLGMDTTQGDRRLNIDEDLGRRRISTDERLGDRRIGVDERLGDRRISTDERLGDRRISTDEKLGVGRLNLDTRINEDRTGLDEGRLSLDTALGLRKTATDERAQQAQAGIGYSEAQIRANLARTEAKRVTNEGRVARSQLGINQQQANTQQAEAQARAKAEAERNIIGHSDIASRRMLGIADISQRERQRATEFFIAQQQSQNAQSDIANRNQNEINRLALEKQQFQLATKVKELEDIRETRGLENSQLQTLLGYTTKIKELQQQKSKIEADLSVGREDIQTRRERDAAESALAARRIGLDESKSSWERQSTIRGLSLKERQQNLEHQSRLEANILKAKEIEAADRATLSQERQNTGRIGQAREDTLSREGISQQQLSLEATKARMSDRLQREGMDNNKLFKQEELEMMRTKLGIDEETLNNYKRDVAQKNYQGERLFQLKLSTARYTQVATAAKTAQDQAALLMAQAAQEHDVTLRARKYDLALKVSENAHRIATGQLQELIQARRDASYLKGRAIDANEQAEYNRREESWARIDLQTEELERETMVALDNQNLAREKLELGQANLDSAERRHAQTLQHSKESQQAAFTHQTGMQASSQTHQLGMQKLEQTHDDEQLGKRLTHAETAQNRSLSHATDAQQRALEHAKRAQELQEKHAKEMQRLEAEAAEARQYLQQQWASTESSAHDKRTAEAAFNLAQAHLDAAHDEAEAHRAHEMKIAHQERNAMGWRTAFGGVIAVKKALFG